MENIELRRAKNIKTVVTENKQKSVEDLIKIVENLNSEIGDIRKYAIYLEGEVTKIKGYIKFQILLILQGVFGNLQLPLKR